MEAVEFEVGGETIVVQHPNEEALRKARLAYKSGLQSALAKGALKRSKAQYLIDEIWGPVEQAEFDRLVVAIQADEAILAADDLSVEVGRVAAERLRRTRKDFWRLRGPRDAIDRATAEDLAARAQFDAIAARCTFHKTGGRYFADVKAFMAAREQGSPVAVKAFWALASGLFGLREDFEGNLPENVFFRRHGLSAQAA